MEIKENKDKIEKVLIKYNVHSLFYDKFGNSNIYLKFKIKLNELIKNKKLTKREKESMFCNICCSETIGNILESKNEIDFKIRQILDLFDYVERKTYYKTKKIILDKLRNKPNNIPVLLKSLIGYIRKITINEIL